jgi:sodium/hydrogen antiporter
VAHHYDLIILVLGVAFLAAAILPRVLRKLPLSLPMVYVGVGMALPLLWRDSPRVDPMEQGVLVERLAELAVIISLMSAGLKLDRPLGLKSWRSTWRLLAITMPLGIAALALGGVFFLGLPLAAAVLLGAGIAPTDPVLALDVQVGPPGEGNEGEMRFALTSEAGLNDGLAFPFVNLAIVIAATGLAADGLAQWLAVDVIWKVAAGTAVGAAMGHGLAMLIFRWCHEDAVTDGFVAIALTLLTYGATELVHGYGFIGVFVAAVIFRRYERNHAYHKALHDFSEQIERLLMVAILILFGASITHGLFRALTWPAFIVGLAFLLCVRPLTGMLGLLGTPEPPRTRTVIAIYGIRGIGTFYYLAYGLNHADISEASARMVWAVAGLIVLASIMLHGATASYFVPRVSKRES